MSNLPSIPPQDSGFQLGAPVEINATPAAPKFRLKKYVYFLRKFWWIPLVTLIIALGAALVDFFFTPPEYVSSASMWESAKLQLPNGASFDQDPDSYFGNMTAVFQSDVLRQRALADMKLNNVPIALDKDGNPIGVAIVLFQAPRSTVFSVQAISANAAFTPAYLNALVNAYIDFTKNAREQVSGGTLDSISAQVSRYEQAIKTDQALLQQYEQSNNLVVLQEESQVGGNYLAEKKTQLADMELRSKLLNAIAEQKGTILSRENTNMANPLFEDIEGSKSGSSAIASSQDTYQQIESLKFERSRLSKNLRPEHPKIVKLDKQIAETQNLLDFYSKENQQDIATARQALEIQMDSLKQSIVEWEAKVNYDSVRIAQSKSLEDNLNHDQHVCDQLSSLMDNVAITQNIDQDPLNILQPAAGSSRSFAKLRSNLSSASFAGLALGLGIVLVIAIRDDRFASIVEVNERIGDTVVGQVPEIPELSRGAPLALLGDSDDQHMYVESYRSLRSALLYFAVDGVRPKVLLITSAVPNEGKSTIASNLACAMALGGSRVLLIDCDLRKGRLHDVLGLQSKPGLAELLRQPQNLDQFIQSSPMTNLSFIARGSGQRNPGDLFLSNAFDEILAKVRERYDYVIIDTSPVFAADDSTTLAPKVDGTLFVVRSRFSRSSIVKEALDLLYQRHATVLGLILNRTDASDRSYHYYKYSEYHTSDET